MLKSHSFRLVEKYLQEYVYQAARHVDDGRATVSHTALLLHMLEEANLVPKRARDVKICINLLVHGKRVLELGCRRGTFLQFLKDHGATVAGTTDAMRAHGTEKKLGTNARIFASTTEDAGTIPLLKRFKPDFILSVNLMDRSRWRKKRFPFQKMYRTANRLAGVKTIVYVAPSLDYGPISWSPRLMKSLRRVHGFRHSVTYPEGQPKRGAHETIRFNVKRGPAKPGNRRGAITRRSIK